MLVRFSALLNKMFLYIMASISGAYLQQRCSWILATQVWVTMQMVFCTTWWQFARRCARLCFVIHAFQTAVASNKKISGLPSVRLHLQVMRIQGAIIISLSLSLRGASLRWTQVTTIYYLERFTKKLRKSLISLSNMQSLKTPRETKCLVVIIDKNKELRLWFIN